VEEGKKPEYLEKILDGQVKSGFGDLPVGSKVRKKSGQNRGRAPTRTHAKIGENLVIRRFVRFELGEGIEKKKEDFASEVAAAMKQ